MLVALIGLTAFAPFVAVTAANRNWFTVVWLGILAWFWFNALFRVDLVGAIDGFHEFIGLVKAANPAVELRGV